MLRVYIGSETAEVELRSGRVYAPAREARSASACSRMRSIARAAAVPQSRNTVYLSSST